MKLSEFSIGTEFTCGDQRWRCTDVGTRIVAAIRIDPVTVTSVDAEGSTSRDLTHDEAIAEGWFNGPPYALDEVIFDENDQESCAPV